MKQHEDPLLSARWFKASRSPDGGNCVEVAITPTCVGIRDTKQRDEGTLRISPAAFAVFIEAVKAGEFDA